MATWKGVTVDARSRDMLEEVQNLLPFAITPTQGSYSSSVGASAGTHSGGGAIDLAGESLSSSQRTQAETTARMVGWAMFIRTPDQSNWPWHLHGIAVECGDMSSAAAGQVDDYFAGRNGLASGAPDTGNRDYVGVTWESYCANKAPTKQEEDVGYPIFVGTIPEEGGRIYRLAPGETKTWLTPQMWELYSRLFPYWAPLPGSPFLEAEVDMINSDIQGDGPTGGATSVAISD